MELISDRVQLEIQSEVDAAAWQQSQSISMAGHRWQAYLNQVCLQTLVSWFRNEFEDEPILWNSANQPQVWELVNGSAIDLGITRLILVPTEAMDHSEFRVPQEWIDLPDWCGDYYLAVEVDPDAQQLEIWGYTTHEALKSSGSYDWRDRTYTLDGSDLILDLTALWVMRHFNEPTRAEVAPLPTLTTAQATNLIQRLADPEIALPRLEVPFSQWAALITAPDGLQQLCQQRQLNPAAIAESSMPVQLSRWFQNLAEAGWRSIESLLESEQAIAYQFRQGESPQELVQRLKWIQLGDHNVRLVMTLMAGTDGRTAVKVQVLSNVGEAYLPENLSLVLRSMTGQDLQSVRSRHQDNYIQLRQFWCPPGMPFQLLVAIDESSFIQDFVT